MCICPGATSVKENNYIRINKEISYCQIVKYGIPQGTVFIVLFLIYINELLDISNCIISFADDTVVIVIRNNWDEVYNNSVKVINKVV